MMAPIRYSLHYEDYSEHLMSRFGKLLQMQSLVDMTLMCSSHTLRVHKAVLAASSAYFQEVLQKQNGEPLIILKMRFSVLKCLVEFMYCGKTQCLEENLDELVSAAQFLKIKGLSKVTKEGLGITDQSEVPLFTPPVVISRPPQSLLDMHTQEEPKCQPQAPFPPPPNSNPPVDSTLSRPNKDMVVRIPFDIENGGSTPTGAEYVDGPRVIKPRRGRPSMRRAGGWDPPGLLGRAAERTLMRREQDSRKAIHQLKHLQTKQMQDYIDRVSLSQAVSSICGPDNSNNHNYMNIDNDLMYMGQRPSNIMDSSASYSKEHPFGSDTTSSFTRAPISSTTIAPNNGGISTAMSQYVNALKNAGLPTDLPILFESGDGSYINVNEQVLLDMVQSSEIQYEVIEQPNIIEKVADPSEIKSIDDLSKSIERGEMLLGPNSSSKPYTPFPSFEKDSTEYNPRDEASDGLNSILPDNLEPFAEQPNFVVMDPRLQDGNSALDSDSTHNFSCMDSDMQFFTKSISDEVKKYYEENQLNDNARDLEQLCPTSTSLDTNFSMSLLDTKTSHTGINQYNSFNPEDDFGLQLQQNLDFKEDALNCIMSTPKHNNDDTNIQSDKANQDRAEIIKELMNIADTIDMTQTEETRENSTTDREPKSRIQNYIENAMNSFNITNTPNDDTEEKSNDLRESSSSSALEWNIGNNIIDSSNNSTNESENPYPASVIDLTDSLKDTTSDWKINEDELKDKENSADNHNSSPPLEHDIPFAVGLLPLNKETSVNESISKRKQSMDEDIFDSGDLRCLKRKIKYKK